MTHHRITGLLAILLAAALAGCAMPEDEARADAPDDGLAGGDGGDGSGDAPRPPSILDVEASIARNASFTGAVGVDRGSSAVAADLRLTGDDEDATDAARVVIRFLDPAGEPLLERLVDVYHGQTVDVKTTVDLGRLNAYWAQHGDREWAPVTLEIDADGTVTVVGQYEAS